MSTNELGKTQKLYAGLKGNDLDSVVLRWRISIELCHR